MLSIGDNLGSRMIKIKAGDGQAREKLLQEARPFIINVVGQVCGRKLSWDVDDELSVGLIAFNEAIDRFNPDQGVPLEAFARLVIRSRVTDHLRRETKWSKVDLNVSDNSDFPSKAELAASWEQYVKETVVRERKEEILAFSLRIKGLGISFEDLVHSSPKHRDTREHLLKAAHFLAGQSQLFHDVQSSGRLPLKEITLGTGISRKILERGRKYLIAVATLIYHQEEFLYLSSYIPKLEGREDR